MRILLSAVQFLGPWWPLAAVLALGSWPVLLAIYRRCFHPLASIPGPFLPAVTRLYQWYWDAPKKGQFYLQIEKLHAQYGPIVRIAPNEVHLSDPGDYDQIYAIGSKFYKDSVVYRSARIHHSGFATIPNELHRRRRARLNAFFSRRTVLELEGVVHAKADKLCARLRRDVSAGVPTDLHSAFRAVSIDVASEYAYGKGQCWNFLDEEDLGSWFGDLVQDTGFLLYTSQQVPLLRVLLEATPDWLAARLSAGAANVIRIEKKTGDHVRDIQEEVKRGMKPTENTIFHTLLDAAAAEGGKTKLTDAEIADESRTIMGAAADTTGSVLTIAAFHILDNPHILKALQDELREAFPDPSASLSVTDLEKLPYLGGVIKEGLRLACGVPGRLPRVVPDGGAVFQGYYIPAGMVVGMSAWNLHRSAQNFPDPETFDPTRWLDHEKSREREKCMVPFSRGQRGCIGRNLAQAELYATLGTLFRRFEKLKVFEFGKEDLVYEDVFTIFPAKGARRLKVVSSEA